METWRKRTIQLLGFSHVQSPPPFYILSILATSSSSFSSLSMSSKTHYNTPTPSEETWQHTNMHIYPWWSDCREKLHNKMLWRKELGGVLLTLFASASMLAVPARSSSMLLHQLLLLLLYPKCLYIDRLTPWRNADHHVFAMKKWLMWHHQLNNLRALLLFCCNLKELGKKKQRSPWSKAKDTLLKQQRFVSQFLLRSSGLCSWVWSLHFQMWEQKKGQEGKTKNFDPGKQIILPSSQHIGIGLPNCDANQRGTIKSKARKQHLLQNKQASEEEGKPESWKPPPSSSSSSCWCCCWYEKIHNYGPW